MKQLLFTFALVLFGTFFVQAQRMVSGVISDESGFPIIGASVVAKEAPGIGTITDIDGAFKMQIPDNVTMLVVSYAGFKSKDIEIGNATVFNVTLDEGAILDEVLVVGYGVQRKSDATSSISSVKGSDVSNLVSPTVTTQLAGRAAGVQVTTANGILGEAPKVRIRGIASVNSGTDPLYVVDGMPIYSGYLGGEASASGLGDLNPADIESYEVLKDGAATAIYGSRGANGVILITTKKGRKGATQISLNSSFGFANAVKTFDLLQTPDFITIANEKRTNRNQNPWAIGTEYNTDWQAEVLNKNAFQTDHSLSVSGGNAGTTYYFSFGYNNQEGIAKSNSMDRYSLRGALDQKVYNWLSVGTNLNVTQTSYVGLNTGGNSLSGNMFNAIRQLPNTPALDPTNPTGYNLSANGSNVGQWDNTDPVGDNISNIAFVLANNTYQSQVRRILASAYASADITKGLNYRLQASVDNPFTTGFIFWSPRHGDGKGYNGIIENTVDNYLRWNLQHILNYNTVFSEKHSLGLTAVAEYQKEHNEAFFSQGQDLLDEFYNKVTVSNSYGVQASGGGATEAGIISYLGRINYNYDQRYFAQFSYRRDGLSKLSEANRWNDFIGYSLGWNIANESFWSDMKNTVSQLKLRYSYAAVGNTEFGSYPYLGLTVASKYGALNGLAFNQFGNDALTWETSKKSDFGLDVAFMDNRLRMSLDYYKNDIDNLVFSEPVPPSLGVPNNRINKNIGKSLNKGFEIEAFYDVMRSDDFQWTLGANLTLSKNQIVELPNGGGDIIGGTSTNVNIAPNIIIREGESMNSLFGYEYWGVNPANGNPVYVKADGSLIQGNIPDGLYYGFDPANAATLGERGALASSDRKILGNTLPTYFGGISSSMNYKNFDLNFLVRFSGGNKIFNSTRRELMNLNLNNNSTEILGRWQSPENPGDGVTPRLWASSNTFVNLTSAATTRFVEDGDFVSIDNITLGYTLASDLTSKIGISGLRVYFAAQNPIMITKYKGLNPEMEINGVDINGTPRARIMSFGLNVKF